MGERPRRLARGPATALSLLLIACGASPPTNTPAAQSSASASSDGTPTAVPAPVPSGSLVLASKGPITTLSNAATDEPTISALPFLLSGLYRLDDTFTPVPDLAASLCEVSGDELTWTCTLADATFHDGEPVTADDVAYTYRLAMSRRCTFRTELCLSTILADVDVEGDSTVVFTMTEPYAPFATLILPALVLHPRSMLESLHATLRDEAERLDLDGIDALAERLDDVTRSDLQALGACETAVEDAEAALAQTPALILPRRAAFATGGEDGNEFDSCMYGQALALRLRAVVAADESDIDAVAAAYAYLDLNAEPIGTGPWRCEPGCARTDGSLTLTAFEGYVHGAPATRTIEMPVIDELTAVEALLSREVDWVRDILDEQAAASLQDVTGVTLLEYPDMGYFSLQYNMRPGQLFAELGARKAIQHCIDKARLVEGATNGTGVPVEGYIHPASWAANTDLEPETRDTRVAMDHLRDAGWTVEDADDDGIADGVATRGEEHFSTNVYVRGQPERIVFMEQVRDSVIDCGIELTIVDEGFISLPVLTYPHIAPNDVGQFHAYFGGWSTRPEPDPFLIFHSSQCTTAENPRLFNYICFRSSEADALIEEGRRVSDIDERARIYRELEQVLYDQQPYLFAWTDLARDAVDARLTSTAGNLDVGSPMWDWQLETLFLAD